MQELEKILEEIEERKKLAYEHKNFEMMTAFYMCQEIICKYLSGKDNNVSTNDGWTRVNATAWMPLSKHYQQKGE